MRRGGPAARRGDSCQRTRPDRASHEHINGVAHRNWSNRFPGWLCHCCSLHASSQPSHCRCHSLILQQAQDDLQGNRFCLSVTLSLRIFLSVEGQNSSVVSIRSPPSEESNRNLPDATRSRWCTAKMVPSAAKSGVGTSDGSRPAATARARSLPHQRSGWQQSRRLVAAGLWMVAGAVRQGIDEET